MYKVILTVIHNVRRLVGDRLLPKAYTVISLGVFFYVAATLTQSKPGLIFLGSKNQGGGGHIVPP